MAARKPSSQAGLPASIDLDGKKIAARRGQALAAALLEAGVRIFSRSVKYHRPRGPFCFAGRCSHCLMRVNGVPNVATCRATVEDSCRVSVQNVMGSAKLDVLGSIDWLFPRGLDHHEMFAGVPVVEKAVAVVARHLAGLGKLPDSAAGPLAPAESLHPDAVVVGAGPAGIAFAQAATAPGRNVVLVDEEAEPGGLAGAIRTPEEKATFNVAVAGLRREGCDLRLSTSVVGHYRDDRGRFLAAITSKPQPRVLKIYFRALGLCTGGQEPLWAFPGNDLPGVYAGRGLARFAGREQFACGEETLVVARHSDATEIIRALESAGAKVSGLVQLANGRSDRATAGHFEVIRAEALDSARGSGRVEKLVLLADGRKRAVACDAAVLCGPISPAFELASEAGCEIDPHQASGGFKVRVDSSGATTMAGVFAAGHACGAEGIGDAWKQGRTAGEAAAAFLGAGGSR